MFTVLEHTCFDMFVPPLNYREAHYSHIQVQIMLNGSVHAAHNQDPILIYPNKKITFIQSDRKVYKPGDKVKIRVLVLSQELTALKKLKVGCGIGNRNNKFYFCSLRFQKLK